MSEPYPDLECRLRPLAEPLNIPWYEKALAALTT
jgi:hypothetical protein